MGAAEHFAAADPLPAVLEWLRQHPAITAAFGGPDHVSGVMEAPWPHLCVTPGVSSDLRDLQWDTVSDVTLDVYGDPAGWPGPAELRRLLLLAARICSEIPPSSGAPELPVISAVAPSGLLAAIPLQNGQQRWTLGLRVTSHPAT